MRTAGCAGHSTSEHVGVSRSEMLCQYRLEVHHSVEMLESVVRGTTYAVCKSDGVLPQVRAQMKHVMFPQNISAGTFDQPKSLLQEWLVVLNNHVTRTRWSH